MLKDHPAVFEQVKELSRSGLWLMMFYRKRWQQTLDWSYFNVQCTQKVFGPLHIMANWYQNFIKFASLLKKVKYHVDISFQTVSFRVHFVLNSWSQVFSLVMTSSVLSAGVTSCLHSAGRHVFYTLLIKLIRSIILVVFLCSVNVWNRIWLRRESRGRPR